MKENDQGQHLRPRRRADLQSQSEGIDRYVVQDPVSASFYSLSGREYAALQLMDGERPLDVILQQLNSRFPTASLDLHWLVAVLHRLRAYHLLAPESSVDRRRLDRTRERQRRRRWFGTLATPLAIRVPLVNPMPLLSRLGWLADIAFSRWVVSAWILASLMLMFLVMREFLSGRVHLDFDLQSIIGDRWWVLLACYGVAKSLHELNHGLACVRFRAKCTELGLLLLCFTPCLYCDTTDSWKLASRWQRAAIAAAGMYAELVLATLAAAIWLATPDGPWHAIAASMMLVCSIGTVFINANPLLKYDGYYILSDLWRVPNLAEQSRQAALGICNWVLTGKRPQRETLDARSYKLLVYYLASMAYRLVILAAILGLFWYFLAPRGLGLLALGLTASVVCVLAQAQYQFFRRLRQMTAAQGGLLVGRSLIGVVLLTASVAAAFLLPLPAHVTARAVTDYVNKHPIFAARDAELVYFAKSDELLHADSLLVKLESLDGELELRTLQGEIKVARKEIEQLKIRQVFDNSVAYELPTLEARLERLRRKVRVLQRELEALTRQAPMAGYFMAHNVPISLPPTDQPDDRRRITLASDQALGCRVARSSLLGWFVTDRNVVVHAVVAENEIRRLRLGASATVQWDADPATRVIGKVTDIAPEPILDTPSELIGDPRLHSIRGEDGGWQPVEAHYRVRIELPEVQRHPGAPATVRIQTASESLTYRLNSFLQRQLRRSK